MRNAREEFLEHTKNKLVICATITRSIDYREQPAFNLKVSFSHVELLEFLQSLNFEYDSGYGTQYVTGTIWYDDGSWSTRGEYYGSEWWELHELPGIPEELTTY